MNIEDLAKQVIEQKMNDGTIEKMIADRFEKGLNETLSDVFSSYKGLGDTIKNKLKEVLVPYVESYDYSEYIVKLDAVLVELLKTASFDNKHMLENFQELMTPVEEKEMKLSVLFEKWLKYVEHNIETDDLEINYDDEPTYEYVECTLEFEEDESRSWSLSERGRIVFECEKDPNMNFEIPVYKWKDASNELWTLEYSSLTELKSLRHLEKFDVMLMTLVQNGVKLEIDVRDDREDVLPDERPEATFG